MLTINNLHATINAKPVLAGVDLTAKPGQVIALMGPNGHGKSTLLKAVMGHYAVKITRGQMTFNDQKLNGLTPDARARLGLYLAAQNPEAIPGVTNIDLIKAALEARSDKPVALTTLYQSVQTHLNALKMAPEMLTRGVNEGFSGGEKKKNEILQLLALDPQLALLDEIDSGLDVDALTLIVAQLKKWLAANKNRSLLVVSHYERFFKLLPPTKVYAMIKGKIVATGGREVANRIDAQGYDWLKTHGATTA